MNTKLFLLALILLLPGSKLMTQKIPDCWCVKELTELFPGDSSLIGSWALDTCKIGIEGNCKELLLGMLKNPNHSVNYDARLYSKTRFEIWIDTILIPRSSSSSTSFSWEDIDNAFIEIKQGMEGLETNYGNYSLIPLTTWENDLIGRNQNFRIEFQNFVNIAEVLNFLYHINDSLPGNLYLHSKYDWMYEVQSGNVDIFPPITLKVLIKPNPVIDYIELYNMPPTLQLQKIEIFSALGIKLIETEYKDRIDISGLTPGVYFVKVGEKVEKFVKM